MRMRFASVAKLGMRHTSFPSLVTSTGSSRRAPGRAGDQAYLAEWTVGRPSPARGFAREWWEMAGSGELFRVRRPRRGNSAEYEFEGPGQPAAGAHRGRRAGGRDHALRPASRGERSRAGATHRACASVRLISSSRRARLPPFSACRRSSPPAHLARRGSGFPRRLRPVRHRDCHAFTWSM